MAKKILALAVAIMLLSVTALAQVSNPLVLAQASEEITGETKTHDPIYATQDGTTVKGIDYGGINGIYEKLTLYSDVATNGDTSTGANSTHNSGSKAFKIGTDTSENKYSSVGMLRFPLSGLNLTAGEIVIKAELKLTSKYNTTQALGDGELKINAYGGFTDTAFGESIELTKTYNEVVSTDALVGSTTVTSDLASATSVTIDVTDYVANLVANSATSADLAFAAPEETAKVFEFISGNSSYNTQTWKPNLVITTMVDPNYGLPEIDTVANEGKTKIRMQTTDTAFSNTSCGNMGQKKAAVANITYNVNVKTAGKYYFSVYTATNQFNNTDGGVTTKASSLTVNGTKLDASDEIFKVSTAKKDDAILTDPTVTPDYLYHNIYVIDLIQGKNTIVVEKGYSSQLGIAYVELTNYERTAATDTKAIAEKGIEILAAVQPTNVVKPTVVYKVYDSIAAANATRGNVVMQLAGGTESHADDCYYIAASYDSNHELQDVELLSFPHYRWTTRTVDFGEFSLEGVDYIKVFAFDGTTLAPVANFGTID